MPHTVTRIEGFEGCPVGDASSGFTNGRAALNGSSGAASRVLIVSSPVRTGSRALRINAPSAGSAFGLIRNRWTGTAVEDSTDLAAAICRFYFRIAVMPTLDSRIFSFISNGSVDRMVVHLDPTGVLQVGSTLGLTVLALNTWYRIEVKYIDGVGGEVRINGDIELTGLSVTAGGTAQSRFGRNDGPATVMDVFYDDVVIETDAAASSIDYPGAGAVRLLDVNANGTDTPHTAGVSDWTAVNVASLFDAVNGEDNGDTDYIFSPATTSGQSFRVATGLDYAPLAAQLTLILERHVSASAANSQNRLRSGTTIASTTLVAADTTYAMRLSVYNTDPNTGLTWTRTAAEAAEPGVGYVASTGRIRVTSVLWQLAEPQPESQAVSPVLEQFEIVTGSLRSTTEYTPELHTIGITSEAFGRPNEVFNVVAANIRYVPTGLDTLRGYWSFDKLDTVGFNLYPNPLRFGVTSTNASSFTYNHEPGHIYTNHILIGGRGKVFEMNLSRAGKQPWEILALDLEIKPEGRAPAYEDGEF